MATYLVDWLYSNVVALLPVRILLRVLLALFSLVTSMAGIHILIRSLG